MCVLITVLVVVTMPLLYAAETLHGPQGLVPAVSPFAKNTLVSAVTGTGTGTAVNLGYPAKTHSITVKLAGTSPTSAVLTPYCSNDGTNYDSLPAFTVTTANNPHIEQYINYACQWLKLGYVTSDASTNVTATVTSVQQ